MAAAPNNKYSQIYNEKELQKLIDSLLEFAEHEKGAHFATWTRRQGKTPQWFNWIREAYPIMEEAFVQAKELMSAKLLNSSIYHTDEKFNAQYAMQYLPIYDKQSQDHMEWKAKLSKQTAENILTTFAEMKAAIADGSLLDMIKQIEDANKPHE